MRSPLHIIGCFVTGLATVALAGSLPTHGSTAKRVEVEGGLRWAELDWSIAGQLDGTDPNVLSELTWSSLAILEVRGAGAVGFLDDRLLLEGGLGIGSLVGGDVQDSDYVGDDRSGEYSRSHASSHDDFVADAGVSIGYQWSGGKTRSMQTDFPSVRRRVVLRAGLSWSAQRLRMTDGVQVLSRPDLNPDVAPEGPFGGLDSTFEARWVGPWLGAEFEHRIGRRSRLVAEAELHLADYDAKANWNLREDFAHPVSFEHFSDGEGYVFALAWRGAESKVERLQVRLAAELWRAEPGIDRTYFADGMVGDTRLNEANWRSALLSVGWRWGP